MLKSLLAETTKVICLYDNDEAGQSGKLELAKTFGRQIFDIEYPVREKD
jgi:DNA primase